MHYKTMVLELLQERPELHEQLKQQRQLLPAVESYARDLKTRHEMWKVRLAQMKPNSDKCQIESEALEIALQGLQVCLDSGRPPDESGPLSLEEAMAYIRKRTPPE